MIWYDEAMDILHPNNLKLVDPTNPMLNCAADDVRLNEITTPTIQRIIDSMLELAAGKGKNIKDTRQMVGLAAPQIGVSKRIITIDITADGSNKAQTLQIFINPEIIKYSKETVLGREGCWSCGNICGIVERAYSETLQGFDRTGKQVKLELTGFVARIAQHEIDHLDGIRFPDRIPLDKPHRLHWVEPAEFDNYRKNWEHWSVTCPRARWDALKTATVTF